MLMLYTAAFCDYCASYEGILARLSRKFARCGRLLFRYIDMSQNTLLDTPVYTFPTVLLYVREDRSKPVEYDGPPDEAKVAEFLRKNSRSGFDRLICRAFRDCEQRNATEKRQKVNRTVVWQHN